MLETRELQECDAYTLELALDAEAVAASPSLGLLAVFGTESESESTSHKAAVISTIGLPRQQHVCRLPALDGEAKLLSMRWSPAGVETMLLLAFEGGAIHVLSMSPPNRRAHR